MAMQFQEPNDQDALVIDPTFEQRERLIEGVHDLADEVHDLVDEVKGFREHLGGMQRASQWQNILQAAPLLPTLAPAVPLALTAVGFLSQPEGGTLALLTLPVSLAFALLFLALLVRHRRRRRSRPPGNRPAGCS